MKVASFARLCFIVREEFLQLCVARVYWWYCPSFADFTPAVGSLPTEMKQPPMHEFNLHWLGCSLSSAVCTPILLRLTAWREPSTIILVGAFTLGASVIKISVILSLAEGRRTNMLNRENISLPELSMKLLGQGRTRCSLNERFYSRGRDFQQSFQQQGVELALNN